MTDSDLDYLVKVVTSIYLERWIEKDRGSRKTISAFSRLGYKNKTSYKKQGDDDKEKANKIYRAYEKYHELFIMRQVQAKEEHERTPIAPYKRKNMSKYDLITLSWCDAWTKGHLRPLELVLFRRHLINRKSKRDTNQNETFCDALMQYYDFLLEIDCCLTKTKTDPIKNVEYVANCILVQKIERVYRFQLITDIVRYCQQFELEPCDFNTAITAAYFRRYSEIGGLFFESINVLDQEGKRKNIRSNDPLGVLNYGTIIHKIAHTHDPDKVDAEVKKELMRRIALMDLLTMVYTVYPVDQQHAWESVDFEDAAIFYSEIYPIVRTYTNNLPPDVYAGSLDEQEKAHCFYDLFHECYLHLVNLNDSPLKDAIDELATKKSFVDKY